MAGVRGANGRGRKGGGCVCWGEMRVRFVPGRRSDARLICTEEGERWGEGAGTDSSSYSEPSPSAPKPPAYKDVSYTPRWRYLGEEGALVGTVGECVGGK